MNCARNIITANFSGGGTSATTAPLWQWDYGQVLCVTGIEDLPAAFEVHFSTNRTGGVSTVAVGADGQVTIPNVLLTIGKNLNAWIYLSDAQGEGETEYSITIPVKARPMPETYDAEVTGEFDDVVRQVSEYAETAQTAADNAGASATAAAASADNAAASASAAETAKTAAETAQGKAEDAQAAAETAAQTATEKAQQTAQDAAQAAQSKADAESAADRAEAAQTGAESAKADAETAAQSATDSASAASASATSAGQSATSAGQSATAAAGSATTAGNAAQTATTKAAEAFASADAAAASETAAQTAQTAAETAATNAGQSASTATTKAAEAAQSASNAAASETAAEAAATRAETAAASLVVDDALSDTSENPVQNKVITGEITQVKNAIDALKIVDTASGAIASFPDGAAMPMEGLTVGMSPIQDLHGQDAPYPAGGGKDLFDKTATNTDNGYVANYYLGATGAMGDSSNYNISEYIPVKASTAYTLSSCAGNASGYCFYDSSKAYISGGSYANNATVTFTTTEDTAYIRVTIPKANIDTFQLEEGSTATAYAPYENICPISGRDSATVERTGACIWGGEKMATDITTWSNFTMDAIAKTVTIAANKYDYDMQNLTPGLPFKENTRYTLICASEQTNMNLMFVYTDGTNDRTLGRLIKSGASVSAPNKTVDYLAYRSYSGTSVINYEESGLFEGVLTAADFVPYDGQSAIIQLGQTVYGGKVDFTTGKMKVTHALKIYDGTQPWSLYTGANGFSIGIAEMQSGYRQFGISNWLRNLRTANDGTMPSFWLGINNSSLYVLNVSSLLSEYTKEAWYAYLTEHPLQIYIPLATPIEIDLTPEQMTTLKGTNNVWSDAGDVSVEYVADPKLYIARLTEPDADMVADANITAGHYFMVGNTLYLATANIASGASIIPGVNCTRTNLAAALNAINV